MINISNLERQHIEIKELVASIKAQTKLSDLGNDVEALAKNINILAGKINIHMNSEDKFLYPKLLEGKNPELKTMAKSYISEMGNIFNEFKNYKDKFNTKSKIIGNKDEFLKESKNIIQAIENRISKEDNILYPKVKLLD